MFKIHPDNTDYDEGLAFFDGQKEKLVVLFKEMFDEPNRGESSDDVYECEVVPYLKDMEYLVRDVCFDCDVYARISEREIKTNDANS